MAARPFLKWAGGKGQLINAYKDYYPRQLIDGKIKRYFEPFLGGGAVFFDIVNSYDVNEFYLSDSNEDLISTYIAVKKNVGQLTEELREMQDTYHGMTDEEQKLEYYRVRAMFNEGKGKCELGDVVRAAQLIFLNKTCFNGLYRVNRKGEFNVPHGRYVRPTICDERNLREVSEVLQRATLAVGSYDMWLDRLDSSSFIYFDPPYLPISQSSSFTSYDGEFGRTEQVELAKHYSDCSAAGALVMLSNSDPTNVDRSESFFDDHYSSFYINRVEAKRFINSAAEKRGSIRELVITNYSVAPQETGGVIMKSVPLYAELGLKDRNAIFSYFLATLKDTIKTWDWFVSWDKVFSNVKKCEVELHILNSLVGKDDIEGSLRDLLIHYPKVLRTIPILVACREAEIKVLDSRPDAPFHHCSFNFSKNPTRTEIDNAVTFLSKSGFLELLGSKKITSVVDYVKGVEVGLDSNGRKNRSGLQMESIVELMVRQICNKHGYQYMRQATASAMAEYWGVHVATDKANRAFDFAIRGPQAVYIIEVNYYSGGGSKLKATAGEYQMLHKLITSEPAHRFIWVTDGHGWRTAASALRETFDSTDFIFNLDLLEKGMLEQTIVNSF